MYDLVYRGDFLTKEYKMKFYGSTTVGERGQLVLPADVRKEFNIKPGDKMVVFGAEGEGVEKIALIKAEHMTKVLDFVKNMETAYKTGKTKEIESMQKKGLKVMKEALNEKKVKTFEKKIRTKNK